MLEVGDALLGLRSSGVSTVPFSRQYLDLVLGFLDRPLVVADAVGGGLHVDFVLSDAVKDLLGITAEYPLHLSADLDEFLVVCV